MRIPDFAKVITKMQIRKVITKMQTRKVITKMQIRKVITKMLLHRNSTMARRITNVTSEHYGDP